LPIHFHRDNIRPAVIPFSWGIHGEARSVWMRMVVRSIDGASGPECARSRALGRYLGGFSANSALLVSAVSHAHSAAEHVSGRTRSSRLAGPWQSASPAALSASADD
jgi:hypothetical protein